MIDVTNWVVSLMDALSAPGVGIALAPENMFPPLPSEVFLPPQGPRGAGGRVPRRPGTGSGGCGGAAFDPEVVRQLLGRTDPPARLIPRERDVLDAMAEGLTNAGVAGRLRMSVNAVEKHAATLREAQRVNALSGSRPIGCAAN